MPSKSVFFVLILASSVMRIFAAGVWGYAKPDSDALVYFNAGQAEKSMEKGLWKKINAEKKAAWKSKSDDRSVDGDGDGDGDGDDDGGGGLDFMRSFADLNPELVANVTLVSRTPIRLMIEGAVHFHSGSAAEAKKSLNGFVGLLSGGAASDGEPSEPASLVVKDVGKGTHEFLFLYNLKKRVQLPPPAPSAARKRLAESFLASKPSICLVLNSIRWAPLLAGTPENRDFRRIMVLAEAMGVAASVRGELIQVSAEVAFRRERDAATYAQNAEAMASNVDNLLSGGPILRKVTTSAKGTSVAISADIGIEGAWSSLTALSTMPADTTMPAGATIPAGATVPAGAGKPAGKGQK